MGGRDGGVGRSWEDADDQVLSQRHSCHGGGELLRLKLRSLTDYTIYLAKLPNRENYQQLFT